MIEPDRSLPAPHHVSPLTRREGLFRAGGGFGALALLDLLSRDADGSAGPEPPVRSGAGAELAAAGWRRPETARNVIFLFIEGGPSHIDLFDPKPALDQLAGKPLPPSF